MDRTHIADSADPADAIGIVYEDAWLLAADKPAGLLVHGDGTGSPALADLVRERLRSAGEPDAAAQLQPVQRLDVDTTGLVLFSKDKEVQPALDALVAAHGAGGIRKRYLAVVRGEWPAEMRVVDAPLARDRHDARRMRVAAGGKPSRTLVSRVVACGPRGERLSLLVVELESGRRHQIRVHLASRGFPIAGDTLYGVPSDRRLGGRDGLGGAATKGRGAGTPLMLHAWAEDLTHPVTGERLALRTEVPVRFSERFPDAEALLSRM